MFSLLKKLLIKFTIFIVLYLFVVRLWFARSQKNFMGQPAIDYPINNMIFALRVNIWKVLQSALES